MSTPNADQPVVDGESQGRRHQVMVRLNDEEIQEVIDQQAELSALEQRSISRAEVVRRRAWGQLSIPGAAA